VFFYGAANLKSQSALFMVPEKGIPSAVVGTVRIGDVGIRVNNGSMGHGSMGQMGQFLDGSYGSWVDAL